LLPFWRCVLVFHVMGTVKKMKKELVSFFMTLTLINKYILNPFNVLYFITFKFIYFFTLQYAFVLIQFFLFPRTSLLNRSTRSDEHYMNSGERNENFKMTCHGSISCDVTVVFRKLFIVTGRRGKNRNQIHLILLRKKNLKIAILQPLYGIFKMFLCSLG
jgi:hypothetical protein